LTTSSTAKRSTSVCGIGASLNLVFEPSLHHSRAIAKTARADPPNAPNA
jgi:hypothetical protein